MNVSVLTAHCPLFDMILDCDVRARLIAVLAKRISAPDIAFLQSERFTQMLLDCKNGTFCFSVPTRIRVPKIKKGSRPSFLLPHEELLLQKYILRALLRYRIDDESAKAVLMIQEKSTPYAIAKSIRSVYRNDIQYCIMTDIRNASESLDRHILLEKLNTYFSDDPCAFEFFQKLVLMNTFCEEGLVKNDAPAVKAGMPLTEFLYYLYFADGDRYLFRNGIPFLRLRDSLYLFAKNREEAESMLEKTRQYVQSLGLSLNEEKTDIVAREDSFRITDIIVQNGLCRIDFNSAVPLLNHIRKIVIKRVRTAEKKGISSYVTMWSTICLINNILYDGERCVHFLFQMNPDKETLHKIDRALQDIVRFAGTGKQSPARYRITYDDIKTMGYRSLVNEYYRWQNS